MKRLFLLVFCALILMNCAPTKVFTIEVLIAAQKEFPSEIKTVLVMERIPIVNKEIPNLYYFLGDNQKDSVHIMRIATTHYIENVINSLNSAQRFQAIALMDSDNNQAINFDFDWPYLKKLCAKYQADAIICLEGLNFDKKNHFNGNISESNTEVLQIKLYSQSLWRFYYPKNEEIIDKKFREDSILVSSFGHNYSEAIINEPSLPDIMLNLIKKMAKTYANRISPTWMETGRIYYKGGFAMKKGARWAKKGEWKKAAGEWKKHINSSNKQTAEFACFNLAVACEMEGLLVPALDWAEKANKFSNSENSSLYTKILKSRIEDLKRLLKPEKQ